MILHYIQVIVQKILKSSTLLVPQNCINLWKKFFIIPVRLHLGLFMVSVPQKMAHWVFRNIHSALPSKEDNIVLSDS